MLDNISVFNKYGVILWSKEYSKLRGKPIHALIKTIILEERVGEDIFQDDRYSLKWILANEHDLVFVIVYQKQLQLPWAETLLQVVKGVFCDDYADAIKNYNQFKDPTERKFDFDVKFEQLFTKIREQERKPTKMKSFSETRRGMEKAKSDPVKKDSKNPNPKEPTQEDDNDNNDDNGESQQPQSDSGASSSLSAEEIQRNREKLKSSKGKSTERKKTQEKVPPAKASSKKKARKWGDSDDDETPSPPPSSVPDTPFQVSEKMKEQFMKPAPTEDDEDEKDLSDLVAQHTNKPTKTSSFFGKFFSGLSGKVLDRSDIEPVIAKFKEHLTTKNVAAEIAEKLCESVATNLIGSQHPSFTSVSTTVKKGLEDALLRILTPKRNIDVLRDIAEAKQRKKTPYSVVFVGVNGVGKSTNLAKVCNWLLQNQISVMIAACDTFRSGAVEQLRVHATNLNVELYQKGYGKDAAGIASDALAYAKEKGIDVVLIDTAGRMQDNEPLMRALSKLVHINNPNLILFVGEALVGNDGVDQLVKFNKAMQDFSSSKIPRLIDGILLTKFDTIDDKVGAALSMVYSTGQPIVFVGTGQHYNSLRPFNVNRVINLLLQ